MNRTIYKLIGSAAVIGILLLYFFLDARKYPFPRCPFFTITHFYCPGCGSQRALSSLLHGQVIEAFRYNSLLVVFIPFLLYSGFVQLRYSGKQTVLLFYKPFFVHIVLAVVLLFWMLRNLPFYPFSILAPAD